MPIHLELEQLIRFVPTEIQEIIEREFNKNTKLTGWFILNQIDPEARKYLYSEIPKHYVWVQKTNKWDKRKQRGHLKLSRIY